MNYKYTDCEIDNLLFVELSKEDPSEKNIRKLISQGANINAIDNSDESLLINAINFMHDGLDLKFIKLIVELGADVNYTEDGLNCLYNAYFTNNPELVEFLLKSGANPNCVSTEQDICLSILDWIEIDVIYEESRETVISEETMNIIQFIKDYGGKNALEMQSE